MYEAEYSICEEQVVNTIETHTEFVQSDFPGSVHDIEQYAITGQQSNHLQRLCRSNGRTDSRTRQLKPVSSLPFYLFITESTPATNSSQRHLSLQKNCYSSCKSFIELRQLLI